MAKNNMSVVQAADLMGKTPQFVRVALQKGLLPFGVAVRQTGRRYSYYISPVKFSEFTGIAVPDEVTQ